MGGTTSSFKKLFSFSSGEDGLDQQSDRLQRVSPYVLSRKGLAQPGYMAFRIQLRRSMYFDEDGDLAHEFYVEENCSGQKATMRKIKSSCLTPQGEVDHPIPRLRFDFPIVLYED